MTKGIPTIGGRVSQAEAVLEMEIKVSPDCKVKQACKEAKVQQG
jgi:hypothetical protein